MRKRGGWVDVRPNDKMQQYDALRDPHLRAMHEGGRVKKHLNKMKQRELEERRNPETEAKLAWRKDVHELYGQPIGVVKTSRTPKKADTNNNNNNNNRKRKESPNPKSSKQNLSTDISSPSPGNQSVMSGSSRVVTSVSRSSSESSYEMVSKPTEGAADSVSSSIPTPREESNVNTATGNNKVDSKSVDDAASTTSSYHDEDKHNNTNDGIDDKQSESSCEYSEDDYSEASGQQPQQPHSLDVAAITAKLRLAIKPDYSSKGLNKPVEVIDNLYLGCVKSARNTKLLNEIGITLVINCAPSQCKTNQSTYDGTDIDYREIHATDEEGYKLLDNHFTEVKELVEPRLTSQKVLIHCFQGVNRSAALVTALIMALNKDDLFTAATTVHSKRPVVLQGNDSFIEQLIQFAHSMSLLVVPDDG